MIDMVSQWTNARVPDGLRLYAIGDIHGRLDLLDAMAALIEEDSRRLSPAETSLVFLGDYVDRGRDSKGVVSRLLQGLASPFETIFLKGNHESLLLSFLDDPKFGLNWLQNGGDATLLSYGVEKDIVQRAFWWGQPGLSEASAGLRDRLPQDHRRFYETLNLSYSAGDYFFVHAGVRPGIALDQQVEDDLLWIRDPFLTASEDFGAVVVHGHTPSAMPEDRRNRIGIDTYAFHTGRLTAVGLEGSKRWFLST